MSASNVTMPFPVRLKTSLKFDMGLVVIVGLCTHSVLPKDRTLCARW